MVMQLDEFLKLKLPNHLGHGSLDPTVPMLDLYRDTFEKVPAYHNYLSPMGYTGDSIQSLEDFKKLPLMTKKEYMQAYALDRRVHNGDLSQLDRVAVSSGSTGTPTFWPRAIVHEYAIAIRFEQVFCDGFELQNKKTLAVVCFALGNWVGGIFTTSCCWHLARKGYPITVATPGNNIGEILRIVRELAPSYDQTVLLGYPPFVRDVVDAGKAEDIDWGSINTRMVFAGEVFSEEWRSALVKNAGGHQPHEETASLYGTADGGVLGNETPYSIAIRSYFSKHPETAKALFGESRLPTLVQYDPRDRYFEEFEGTLVVSGENGVPLVRYHIADKGGVIPFDAMEATLEKLGVLESIRGTVASSRPIRPLPFVYVFGRADFTVSYYGANVYPENVSVGLEHPDIQTFVTGKFVLEILEQGDGNPELVVTVELRKGAIEDEAKIDLIAASIKEELLRLNSEFAHYVPRERHLPKIIVKPFGDPKDFPLGVKHRYTRKGL